MPQHIHRPSSSECECCAHGMYGRRRMHLLQVWACAGCSVSQHSHRPSSGCPASGSSSPSTRALISSWVAGTAAWPWRLHFLQTRIPCGYSMSQCWHHHGPYWKIPASCSSCGSGASLWASISMLVGGTAVWRALLPWSAGRACWSSFARMSLNSCCRSLRSCPAYSPLQNLRWVDVFGWGRSLGLCRRLWLDVRLLGRRCRHW